MTARRLILPCALLAALLTAAPAHAQGFKVNQPSKRNNGSAAVLTGEVCLLHLFVEDKDSKWAKSDQDELRARAGKAIEFIALYADRYGKKVKFTQVFREGFPLQNPVPTDLQANPAWTEDAIKATGVASANALVDALKKAYKADHVLILLHVNKNATSYTLSFYDNVDQTYLAERAVCYARYPNGAAVAPATLVNHILCAFGAGQLHFPFDNNDQRKNLAKKLFPDEVMYRVDNDLSRQNIGAYTAYRIGWTPTLKDEHRVFED